MMIFMVYQHMYKNTPYLCIKCVAKHLASSNLIFLDVNSDMQLKTSLVSHGVV